jgi:hypothetical protein
MPMESQTGGHTTSFQMVSNQVLEDKVTIITGIGIDIYKMMILWINAGKSERELG